MRCQNCGHLNKSNVYYCVKCGSALETNNIIQYKKNAQEDISYYNSFSKTQKFIIALVIIGILIVVFSAVTPPDLEFPSLASPSNDTQDTPVELIDQTVNKLNTTIKIGDISAKTGEKVNVNAYVYDENGNAVTSGTTSITLFDTKYSGQVENGNVNIILPELNENNYETTIVYEGNDKYNPSETRAQIEVNKQNTQLETIIDDENLQITLKTGNDEKIPGQTITITGNDTDMQEQTDDNGNVNIKLNLESGKQELKITYDGNENYAPAEKTIEYGEDRKNTQINTEFDQDNRNIIITLTDDENNTISDATLTIKNNNEEKKEKTDNNGIVKIEVKDGENKITIKYDGNGTFNPSETTLNTIIEHNDTNNSNNTIYQDNHTNASNKTENKINTMLEVDRTDNQTIITLIDENNKVLSGEYVDIKLDNGTILNEKTTVNGTIILNIDYEYVNEIELEYGGNENYNSVSKLVHINH